MNAISLPSYFHYIILIIALIVLQNWQLDLRFHREFIAQGEWWRFWSGHLVHNNTNHLLLNSAGVIVLALLKPPALSFKQFIFILISFITGISTTLWFLQPQLVWYVGLSGVLYGAFLLLGFYFLYDKDYTSGLFITICIVGKIFWDFYGTPDHKTSELIDAPVVIHAHLYGAYVALVIAIGLLGHKKLTHDTT